MEWMSETRLIKMKKQYHRKYMFVHRWFEFLKRILSCIYGRILFLGYVYCQEATYKMNVFGISKVKIKLVLRLSLPSSMWTFVVKRIWQMSCRTWFQNIKNMFRTVNIVSCNFRAGAILLWSSNNMVCMETMVTQIYPHHIFFMKIDFETYQATGNWNGIHEELLVQFRWYCSS